MERNPVAVRGRAMEHGAAMNLTAKQLEEMGYVERNGEWTKRTATRGLGAVVPGVREQPTRPLESQAPAKQGGEGSVVEGRSKSRVQVRKCDAGLRVTLIAVRQKRLDDDNLAGGFKALRDAIADSLGIDDGDERIEWIYRQQVGPKPHGTIVMITTKKG